MNALAHLSEIDALLGVAQKLDMTLSEDDTERASAALEIISLTSQKHSWPISHKKCVRIQEYLQRKEFPMSAKDLAAELKDLRERIRDELDGELFLHLSSAQYQSYSASLSGWEDIIRRFDTLRYNIEESGKCFALERFGAAVFHILLVAEYGVIRVASLVGVADSRVPGWGDLERIDKFHRREWNTKTALEQEHSTLIREFLPLAFAVKNSWRHKISHVDKQMVWMDTDFSPHVAGEIISATRGFMRKLASDLP